MIITTRRLTGAAAICAAAAGAIFIGVQINHPHMDTTSITTTEVAIRNSLKVLMPALALAGITGMYLSQVRRSGFLGLKRANTRNTVRRRTAAVDLHRGGGMPMSPS